MSALNLGALATDMIQRLGYGGLAVGLIVDSAGIPIPSEVLLPLAGAAAQQGKLNLAAVIVVGALAQTAGAVLAYWIGAKGGLPLVERFGKYVFFSSHELARTQSWFDRYGTLITLVGRCLPGVRTYIGFPPGVARMPFGRFLLASAIGSTLWTLILVGVGYYLSNQLPMLERSLHGFGTVILAAILLAAVAWVVWHLRKRQAA